jgi:hypothetical protein
MAAQSNRNAAVVYFRMISAAEPSRTALPVGRRWEALASGLASRTLSGAASVPVTAGYAAALVAVGVTLTVLGPAAHDAAVSHMSTNLHNLAHGQVGSLVGSAFVTDGGDIYAWLPGLVSLLVLGELIWRSWRLVITLTVAHIGATLLVAAGLVVAIKAGWLPISVAHASDVGISYCAAGVLGALTASVPSRWRPTWIGWWVGTATAAVVAAGADFTAVGHAVALLLGLGLSYRLPRTARWTPIRMVLLAGGGAFGYLTLTGSLTIAPLAGLAGALIAVLAKGWLARFRQSRTHRRQDVVSNPLRNCHQA